ncbi:6-hydroxymethylpterin diphosphokinase MptE-like protein [Shewanella xiamenensis]|uniref:6-hydroxymethylpterin diphosphokinase MptE-like protein n=1 Tax=Shewanella xiamenensis TaxID=332186 RepID=UPI0035B7ED87
MINKEKNESSGLFFSSNKFGEKVIHAINQITFDRFESKMVFKSHFKDEIFEKDTFNVVIGTDSGLLIDYIVNFRNDDNSVYYFVEHQDVIEFLNKDVNGIESENVFLLNYEDLEGIINNSNIAQYIYKNKLRFFESLGACYDYLDIYHGIKFKAHAFLERLSFLNRVTLGSENFIIRQLQNVCENILPVMPLKGCFDGASCIILGGGPSLDDVLPWVIHNKESMVIIAVSRIAKRLQDVGLIPDIVVSVDPFDDSFDVSKEALLFPSHVILVNSYHVVSSLVSQWNGPNIYLGSRFPWGSKCNLENILSAGPTVTNSALSFALGVGFSQILFAGVDLCFSSDGYTHAKGSIEASFGPSLTADGLWVETNNGQKAETSFPLVTAKEKIEQALEEMDKPVSVINLARNGAKIKGTIYQDIIDIELNGVSDSARNILSQYCSTLTSSKKNDAYKEAFQELLKVKRDLSTIVSLANECIEINAKFYLKGTIDLADKLQKKQQILDKKYSYLGKLLKAYGLSYFVEFMAPDNVENWDNKKLEENGRLYYQAYINSANGLLKLINNAIKRTESRIDELNDNPNFENLLAQWDNDKQYGRATFYLNNNSSALSEGVLNSFKIMANKFTELLKSNDTTHFNTIKKQVSIDNLEHKVVQLFAKRDMGGLLKLNASLSMQPGDDGSKLSLQSLINGYINVLRKELDLALSFFENTTVENHRIYALNQIVGISIGNQNYHRAVDGLKELSDFSPSFLPKLARLQYLTSDVIGAIESYNKYLTLYGEDIQVWLSLAKLFFEIQAYDSAKVACEYIISVEPANKIAYGMLKNIATLE